MKAMLPQLPWLGTVCHSCRQRLAHTRPSILQSPPRRLLATANPPSSPPPAPPKSPMEELQSSLDFLSPAPRSSTPGKPPAPEVARKLGSSLSYRPPPKPHHLHIFATKHNCHMTLTNGRRDPLISVSTGNLNFRKAKRGSYDAAYQLGIYMMGRIKSMGLLSDACDPKKGPIRQLEVLMRDFGPGREAVSKILLGAEGLQLRQRVVRVMDSTRLKFGGTRSRKPRRLG